MDLNIRFGGHTELCKAFDPLSWHHGGSDSHHVCQVGPREFRGGGGGQQRTDVMTEWTYPPTCKKWHTLYCNKQKYQRFKRATFFFFS